MIRRGRFLCMLLGVQLAFAAIGPAGSAFAAVTSSFPTQSQWVTYVGGWDLAQARAAGRAARDDGAHGIVVHLQPGMRLPQATTFRRMQRIWRRQGHRIYLSLYLKRLGAADLDKTRDALLTGQGWDGLILDVEAEWADHVSRQPDLARSDFDTFVATVRPMVPLLAYSSFALAACYPAVRYDWFDEAFDVFLPQVYVGIRATSSAFGGSARRYTDAMRDSVASVGLTKPIVPVGDPWGNGADPTETRAQGHLSIARYGAVTWWRQPFVMKSRLAFRSLTSATPLLTGSTAETTFPQAAGAWSALGSDGSGGGALDGRVSAIVLSGHAVYVGGSFTDAGGNAAADYVAKWDGTAWSALGSDGSANGAIDGPVAALAISGADLYVGGSFTDAGGNPAADYVARWDGTAWSALGSDGSANGALDGPVAALAISGSDLYVGGSFNDAAGDVQADNVARWDGTSWSALGGTTDGAIGGRVNALAVSLDDLYVGGAFTDADGIAAADHLARWDGDGWSALGDDGSGDGALDGPVEALAASCPVLYVGGSFANAAGLASADGIAEWDGHAWWSLGADESGDGAVDGDVAAIAIGGRYVYAGGSMTDVAGIARADRVARWNGTDWSAIGDDGAGGGALGDDVAAIAASDKAVYVGGAFLDAAAISAADRIARWNPP